MMMRGTYHHTRFGRMAAATAGRQATPISPSPSPEPTQPGNGGGGAFSAGFLRGADGGGPGGGHGDLSLLDSNPMTRPALSSGGNAAAGQIPFHEILPLDRDDPSEPYRQRVEDCTRNVIDSLYQLAVCAADVQPGREDIIGTKVNETIAQLAALSSASTSNPDALPCIPQEVLEAVDEGRNPDALSKNRMARLVSDNQQLAGQRWALEEYRQELSKSVLETFPELAPSLEEIEKNHRAQRTRPTGQVAPEESTAMAIDDVAQGGNTHSDRSMPPPPPPPTSIPAPGNEPA
ncbi:unnamed protein product [Parajaminaea phylloscopi]